MSGNIEDRYMAIWRFYHNTFKQALKIHLFLIEGSCAILAQFTNVQLTYSTYSDQCSRYAEKID